MTKIRTVPGFVHIQAIRTGVVNRASGQSRPPEKADRSGAGRLGGSPRQQRGAVRAPGDAIEAGAILPSDWRVTRHDHQISPLATICYCGIILHIRCYIVIRTQWRELDVSYSPSANLLSYNTLRGRLRARKAQYYLEFPKEPLDRPSA